MGLPTRAAMLGATAVLWVLGYVAYLPGHAFDSRVHVINDPGSFLYAIDLWRAGGRLYHDFWWQYGPLSLAWYRCFAAFLGNTPLSLVVAAGTAMGCAWVVLASLWMRVLGPWLGWAFAAVVLLPAMTPACLFFANNGPNGALEALIFSGLAWVLSGGGARRPWLAGVLLGLLQWVRFGPHLVAGLAVLVLFCLVRSRPVFSSAWRCAAAYLLVLAPLAAWFLCALPPAGAADQLWPSFMVKHYQLTYGEAALGRFPLPWVSGDALFAWLAAAVGLVGLAGWATRARVRPEFAGMLFPPLFFALGCVFLFRTHFLVLGHAWMCLVALPAFLASGGRLPWVAGALGACVAAANLAMVARVASEENSWHARPGTLPNGQQLWFHGQDGGDFAALAKFLRTAGPGGREPTVAVFYYGGGIHHFFNVGIVGRHWWFMPEFVRPWEAAEVAEQLGRHDLFILWDERVLHGIDTAQGLEDIGHWLPLPPAVRAELIPKLGVARILHGIGYGVPNLSRASRSEALGVGERPEVSTP
jgi:hypothetical protein